MTQNHYETLGLTQTASEKEVVQAYRALIRTWHPDIAGPSGAEKTAAINFAYDVLRDPVNRRDYDRSLAPAREPEPAQASPRTPAPPRNSAGRRPRVPVHLNTSLPNARRLLIAACAGAALIVAGGAVMTQFWGSPFSPVLAASLVAGGVASLGLFHSRAVKLAQLAVLLVPALCTASFFYPAVTEYLSGWFLAAGTVVSAGIALLRYAVRARGKNQQAKRAAAAWEKILDAEHTGGTIFWVADVAASGPRQCDVLLQRMTDDTPNVTMLLWGLCRQGDWIVVSDSAAVTASAPNESPTAWERFAKAG